MKQRGRTSFFKSTLVLMVLECSFDIIMACSLFKITDEVSTHLIPANLFQQLINQQLACLCNSLPTWLQ